ncbi:hypothetical protein PsorP6_015177 [Peronosclerospora sorghi]|uniref:Uncharacterized protein n=1 Tax=Peronosclerospora sorghi TaxID=230839 RepID=A0ACC0VT83_9STRA|nr:hypothetical protein PsorP6_015177 [Peronosclerospora sorghi]
MTTSMLEQVLETTRLVLTSLAAVLSTVVAVVLYRKIPDHDESLRPRRRAPSRKRPLLPPAHATSHALYFALVMTDWLVAVTGAVNQSMDMVMGSGIKVRTVLGASIDAVYNVSLFASMLWGLVLAVFVVRTHGMTMTTTSGHGTRSGPPPTTPFPVRTSWCTVWTLGLGCGVLSTMRLQALVTNSTVTDTLATCQRYVFLAGYVLSAASVLATNVLMWTQRTRRTRRHTGDLRAHDATVPARESLGDSLTLSSTKAWELETHHALWKAHAKLMHYFLLILTLQLPMMLCYLLGHEIVSYTTYEVADCLLFSVPLLNALAFGLRLVGDTHLRQEDEEGSHNRTVLQSSTNSSRHGERPRERMGTGVAPGSGNGGVANVFAVSGTSAASQTGKDTTKGTYVGNDMGTLEELTGLSNVSFIAEGAGGSVFKAQWLGIEVAMKMIKLPNGGAGADVDADLYRTMIQNAEEAFMQEAKLCSRLRHPNITLFMRAGYFEGKLGILTEYCSRGSLKDVLKQCFPLDWRRKVALALHIAKGLTYLHARNPTYIHRDLKASNILVTETWQAKLADFGISKVSNFVNRVRYSERTIAYAEQNPSISDDVTSFAGTWRWNAPEILQDPHNCRYSRATDMYSFGMVLWEIASDGAVPFSDTKFDFEVREKVLVEQRPPINPGQRCPPRFAQLIEECWAQNPSQRPSAPRAAEILNALLDTMAKDSNEFGTLASGSGSEYTNSVFSSLRTGDGISDLDRLPTSSLGQRITNFFRGRFSVRSSTSSAMSEEYHDHLDHEPFSHFMSACVGPESIGMLSARGSVAVDLSPAYYESAGLPMIGLPAESRRGDGLMRRRLSSLDEYDFEMDSNTPDTSSTFVRHPSEGATSSSTCRQTPNTRHPDDRPE